MKTIQPGPDLILRLAKLAGMFGSDFEGERANAAALASRLLRDNGMTWSDVINPGGWPREEKPPPPPPPDPPSYEPEMNPDLLAFWPGGWRSAARLCVRIGEDVLPAKDYAFVRNIADWPRMPSPAQFKYLRDCLDKVCERVGERAW